MKRIALGTLLLLAFATFLALGAWQLERRAWKHALVAQVDARLAAAPVAAPGPAEWRGIGPDDAYLRVRVEGLLRTDRQARVQAVTRYGPGFWLLAPVETDGGTTVLVNRGFVPGSYREQGGNRRVAITGLLRLSEPGGAFLRQSDPAHDRWYSRDVAAIAAARGLGQVAPYFVDADASPGETAPRGGLTTVTFPDNHLQYALTWFAMAALLGGATGWMVFRRRAD